ncbi:MAG: DUF2344 domain-containing protein [Frankiales bacterium]|nr:DUF2344 domain-containing protein [Frankiales bacterium]
MQRLWVRYAKRGRLRFTSHRDFARAFERALRRAGVPMAYSAGFSPHPKISYVGAAPTGVASEAEYLEIGLAERRDPDEVRRDLDAALPPGLDVIAVVEADQRGLADRVEASYWRIELPGVAETDARAALDRFLALASAPVERATKDGHRTIDARAAVLAAEVLAAQVRSPAPPGASQPGETAPNVPCAILDLVVRLTTPAVRPDDVVTALRQAAALSTPDTTLVTRLAQGRLDDSPPATDADETPAVGGIRLIDPLVANAGAVPPN